MQPEIEIAQALVDLIAFFLPAFIVMLAVEWAVGFFRSSR